MEKTTINITYTQYLSAAELEEADRTLLDIARTITKNAYAPYSNFNVGAAARLMNGEIITGTNQENASFPAGICAERTLLSVAASLFPGVAIDTIAISYMPVGGASDKPITPCGICRQSLKEYEARVGRPIRLVLGGTEGGVIVLDNITSLLPLSFGSEDLK